MNLDDDTYQRIESMTPAELLRYQARFAAKHPDFDEWLWDEIYRAIQDDLADAADTARNAA